MEIYCKIPLKYRAHPIETGIWKLAELSYIKCLRWCKVKVGCSGKNDRKHQQWKDCRDGKNAYTTRYCLFSSKAWFSLPVSTPKTHPHFQPIKFTELQEKLYKGRKIHRMTRHRQYERSKKHGPQNLQQLGSYSSSAIDKVRREMRWTHTVTDRQKALQQQEMGDTMITF